MKTHILRKSVLLAMLIIFSFAAFPSDVHPLTPPVRENSEQRVRQLESRLEEIRSMDKRTLSRAEKKELRMEVHAIKKEMKTMAGGVYISIGALILIALLLIILL